MACSCITYRIALLWCEIVMDHNPSSQFSFGERERESEPQRGWMVSRCGGRSAGWGAVEESFYWLKRNTKKERDRCATAVGHMPLRMNDVAAKKEPRKARKTIKPCGSGKTTSASLSQLWPRTWVTSMGRSNDLVGLLPCMPKSRG